MALPARRGGTVTRPGSQAEGRWDPSAEFEDLYQQMGRLMDSAFGGMWQPLAQAWAPLADLSETDDAYVAEVELPGVLTVPKAETSKPRWIEITGG
jgi:HSP20 family protein